jgi:hypothetical protein
MTETAPKKRWPLPPKTALAVIVVTALVATFIWQRVSLSRMGSGEAVMPDGAVVKVEIADNKITMERGLSGRDSLDDGRGMVFLFPSADTYSFWMKGMRFAIDIIWMRGEQVVAITENAPPPDGADFMTYVPPSPVDRVLEVPAGYAAAHGIGSGDTVVLRIDSRR